MDVFDGATAWLQLRDMYMCLEHVRVVQVCYFAVNPSTCDKYIAKLVDLKNIAGKKMVFTLLSTITSFLLLIIFLCVKS